MGYYYTNVSMINVMACFFHVLSSFIQSVSKYTYPHCHCAVVALFTPSERCVPRPKSIFTRYSHRVYLLYTWPSLR